MKRGDVVWVDLDPSRPDEAATRRPCIVVSNEGANSAVTIFGRGVVSVVPLTTAVARVHDDFQQLISDPDDLLAMGLAGPSKAQAEQVRAVSVRRVGDTIGAAPSSVLRGVDDALRFHLSL